MSLASMIGTIGLGHFLVLAAILFSIGVYCVTARRNAVAVLMGVELILNAANVNLVAFTRFVTHSVDGTVFALFGIVLAAAEAAVALAIVLQFFRHASSIDTTDAGKMKG